jgi:uncharacterized membrane protein YdjX (TVP38/TMEM64 family)
MAKSNRRARYLGIILMAAMIIISVGGSVLLIQHYSYIAQLESQGYLGLFIISLFAGSPIPIPTPSMILTFTLGSILSPFLVGLVSGFGNGVGNALVYWAGRGGLAFFQSLNFGTTAGGPSKSRWDRFLRKFRFQRLRDFVKRRVLLAVFLLSIYPNPFVTPLILGMGATKYSFWKFFLACWAGKTTQAMILSFVGYFGLRSLLRYLGIFSF